MREYTENGKGMIVGGILYQGLGLSSYHPLVTEIYMQWHIRFIKNLRKSTSRIIALKFSRKLKGKNDCAISYGLKVQIVLFDCAKPE